MAIPAGVQKVVLEGTHPGGEIFQTGFWLKGGLPSSSTAANIQAELLRDALVGSTFFTAMKDLICTDTAYKAVRVYVYPSGGPRAVWVGEAAITGGAGVKTTYTPLQQCMVLTLRTGLSGRQNRGRMYLPASGQVISVDHLYTPALVADVATKAAAFFTAWNAGDAGKVTVVSTVGSTDHLVTEVRVDNVVDIQRRRANAQNPSSTAVKPVS